MAHKQIIPFTKVGYEKLLADQVRLRQKRQETVVRVQTAREMGDLSENGAYKYGKMELSDISRQLRQIDFLLKNAEVTQPQKNGTVGFGSLVTLVTPAGEKSFTLVSEHESDPEKNRLSMHSPLGTLLMGKKAGESVNLSLPAGTTTYKIIKVE
jgi:transcription elongation GreA/GreB family factor